MTDADWLGKVQRRNVRRGKPHQGEESLRIGWRYLENRFAILFLSNLGTGDCAEVWLQQQREDEVGVAEQGCHRIIYPAKDDVHVNVDVSRHLSLFFPPPTPLRTSFPNLAANLYLQYGQHNQ